MSQPTVEGDKIDEQPVAMANNILCSAAEVVNELRGAKDSGMFGYVRSLLEDARKYLGKIPNEEADEKERLVKYMEEIEKRIK